MGIVVDQFEVINRKGGARRGAGRPSNEQRRAAEEAGLKVRDIREIDLAIEDMISNAEEEENLNIAE